VSASKTAPRTALGEAELAAEQAIGVEPAAPLDRAVGRNLWTGNLVGSSAGVLLGLYVIVSGIGFGFGTPSKPGAGVFPVAIGIVLMVLSAVWLVQCLLGRVRREDEPADSDRAGQTKIVLSIAVIVAFGLLVNILGYQLSMLLIMATLLTLIARTRWWMTIVLAASMAFGTFALFDYGLGVLLPVSSIPFLQYLGL
jgi:putative tricarboxylic transport membrane protein